ncbi:type II toxin-antitoxin system RelE/ParE family toxin [Thiomicrospira microaerophila]|uniref:type II toxin-antitoxin system RelE/ParE family toxin n=1 Tax=Thiomicrospira microaerophila TaxID=406020 RepID=UPI00200F530E|nr:type II toxin-antitoxin system RelE/ParE family toxin [Thiomicrospira microaerophila]UQB41884.1 type II toxin-antitoxin system RelE/ParE family toxin [Thiomicrospira microaerophila]
MTRLAYRLTAEAKADLIDIRRYNVKNWGEVKSQAYLSGLRDTIQRLAAFPLIGEPRPDIAESVFSFPYVSHMIYYTLEQHQLWVFGVIHQSRVPNLHLENRNKP